MWILCGVAYEMQTLSSFRNSQIVILSQVLFCFLTKANKPPPSVVYSV